jgi:hypothetical protein
MTTTAYSQLTQPVRIRTAFLIRCVTMTCLLFTATAFASDPVDGDFLAADDITLDDTLSDANAASFDFYGGAVSVFGDWAMVGAESNSDVDSNAGAVFVYQYVNDDWVEVDELNASDAGNFGLFGGSVSLDGNTAVIGARGDDGQKGAAYVFEWSGAQWLEVDKLIASDATAGDQFGYAVSLHGNRLVVTAPRDDDASFNSGTAYVFEHNGMDWIEMGKLGPDAVVFEELFGTAVSLDGDRVIIGAYNGVNPGGTRTGTAYIFQGSGMSWSQVGKFNAADGAANDYFGYAVSLSGDHALVGAHGDDVNTGAVYAYSFNGASWGGGLKLNASDAEMEDAFGISVNLKGNRALIGAYRADNAGGADSGAAYVLEFDGLNWNEERKLSNSAGANNHFLGRSVAQTNTWILVGSDGVNGNRGEVRVYLDDPVYLDGFDAAPGSPPD